MEPFHVICETCGARLKVRSVQVIGEIHACPKCESMVQIVPPAGWSAIAAGMSHEFMRTLAVSDAAVAIPTNFAVPEIFPSDLVTPPAEIAAASEPALPVAASSAPWLLWGVAGAAVLAVGGLVVALWPGSKAEVAPPRPTMAAPVAAGTGEPAPEIDSPGEPAAEPAAGEPPAIVAESTEEPAVAEALPSPPALPDVASDGKVAAAVETQVAEPVAPTLPPPAESVEAEPPVAKEASHSPVMKFDPLDFDPTELTLAANAAVNAAPAAGSIPPNAEGVGDAPPAEATASTDESVPAAKIDQSLTVRLGPMLDGVPRAHGAAVELSLRVPSFDVAGMPLQQFVSTLSDMANLAITVDPVALELAGISARQPMTAKAADATVEKLLTDSLAKLRLGFVDNGGHIKLTVEGGDKRRAVDYDVADLVGDDGGKQLTSLVQHFVAPESWQAGGGSIEVRGTKLRVDHTQNIRHQVLIFCERLRLARGLSLRSRYPAALLSVVPADQRLAAKLSEKTTFTFLPWSRLSDVVRHWQDSSGLTILVDWTALADAELSPLTPIACSANDRSWQDVFDKTLEPIGLAWWPLDKDTIQITSIEAIDDVQRIEFYPISKPMREQFSSNEALVASLQEELAQQEGGQLNQPVMSIDEASGRLIVLGSPAVQRILGERFAR